MAGYREYRDEAGRELMIQNKGGFYSWSAVWKDDHAMAYCGKTMREVLDDIAGDATGKLTRIF